MSSDVWITIKATVVKSGVGLLLLNGFLYQGEVLVNPSISRHLKDYYMLM